MAVEIIPKPEEKKYNWQNFLLYFSLLLLGISILSYFVLDNSVKNSYKILKDLEREIAQKETPQVRSMEKEILNYQKKIQDFSNLLNAHRSVLGVFDFLESNCHPKVWFSNFSFNAENSQVNLSGQAEDFVILEQQLRILKKRPQVKELNLSTISMGEEGTANFGVNIIFNQDIFIPQK